MPDKKILGTGWYDASAVSSEDIDEAGCLLNPIDSSFKAARTIINDLVERGILSEDVEDYDVAPLRIRRV